MKNTASPTTPNLLIQRHLDKIIYVLFVLQPLLNALSYWTGKLGGSSLTLLLRFGVFAAVALLGFLCSERKWPWLIFGGLCAAFWLCHSAVCASVGYENRMTDLTNFIRVLQMPVFAISFIVFLRGNPKLEETLRRAMGINLGLIGLLLLLSVATGTSAQTYSYNEFGFMGWVSNSNAQSAILSALISVTALWAVRRNSLPFLAVTVAAGFSQLYFLGTRLAFGTIIATATGAIFAMILVRKFSLAKALVLLGAAAVCVLTVRLSPMYRNQNVYNAEMNQKQGWESGIYEQEKQDAMAANAADLTNTDEDADQKALSHIYEFYAPKICERFGTEKVMQAYGYTQDVRTITAARPQKILYCRLLLQEYPFSARLFGMELAKMTYDGAVFDVENDFHGIFFLYGAVGLALMLLFLLVFVLRILRCLISDFRRYFTLDATGAGLAFGLLMAYCYFTAGVLRRPEASFYLSAVLAMIWSMTRSSAVSETEAKA